MHHNDPIHTFPTYPVFMPISRQSEILAKRIKGLLFPFQSEPPSHHPPPCFILKRSIWHACPTAPICQAPVVVFKGLADRRQSVHSGATSPRPDPPLLLWMVMRTINYH